MIVLRIGAACVGCALFLALATCPALAQTHPATTSRPTGRVITSARSGPWSEAATWAGGQVPGDNDTVTAANGHTVTVDRDTVVGAGGDAKYAAVLLSGAAGDVGGALVVDEGKKLTCKGGLVFEGYGSTAKALTLKAGSTLEFDASAAAEPEKTVYLLGARPMYCFRPFVCEGTAEKRVTIRTVGTGANVTTNNGNLGGLSHIDARYTDFIRLGGPSADHNRWDNHSLACMPRKGPATVIRLGHCTFDRCGMLMIQAAADANAEVILDDCRITNPLGKTAMYWLPAADADKPAVRRMLRNYVEGDVWWAGMHLDARFNVFRHSFQSLSGAFAGRWKSFENNVICGHRIPDGYVAGDVSNLYVLMEDGFGNNPHFPLNIPADMGQHRREVTVRRAVIQYLGKNGEGNAFGGYVAPEALNQPRLTVRLRECIVLPDGTGKTGSSDLAWVGAASTYFIDVDHCTIMGHESVSAGEFPTPPAGALKITNSIIWDTAPRAPVITCFRHTPENLAYPRDLHHNAVWQMARAKAPGKSNDGTFYGAPTTGPAPGEGDVNADPQFVDPSRNLATWGKARQNTDGSVHAAALALAKDPEKNIRDLFDWVCEGFIPRNAALHRAASDGRTIGAVPAGAATRPAP